MMVCRPIYPAGAFENGFTILFDGQMWEAGETKGVWDDDIVVDQPTRLPSIFKVLSAPSKLATFGSVPQSSKPAL